MIWPFPLEMSSPPKIIFPLLPFSRTKNSKWADFNQGNGWNLLIWNFWSWKMGGAGILFSGGYDISSGNGHSGERWTAGASHARGMSSVRYRTRLSDLKNKQSTERGKFGKLPYWILAKSNKMPSLNFFSAWSLGFFCLFISSCVFCNAFASFWLRSACYAFLQKPLNLRVPCVAR